MESPERLGLQVQRRIGDLYGTKAKFYRAAKRLDPDGEGLSSWVLRWAIDEDRAPVRGDKRRLFLRVLKWSEDPDSFIEIANGRPPIEDAGLSPADQQAPEDALGVVTSGLRGIAETASRLAEVLARHGEGR